MRVILNELIGLMMLGICHANAAFYQPDVHSLEVSVPVFKDRFNKISKQLTSSFRINSVKFEKGKTNSFSITFNKDCIIFGTTTKDGMIEGALSISSYGGAISRYEMMELSTMMIRSFSPELADDEVGKIAVDMGHGTYRQSEETRLRRVGNIEYSSSASKDSGYWFSVQASPHTAQ